MRENGAVAVADPEPFRVAVPVAGRLCYRDHLIFVAVRQKIVQSANLLHAVNAAQRSNRNEFAHSRAFGIGESLPVREKPLVFAGFRVVRGGRDGGDMKLRILQAEFFERVELRVFITGSLVEAPGRVDLVQTVGIFD